MVSARGFPDQKSSDPVARRGERVARWVEDYMAAAGCSLPEIAFRVRQDKRDLERLISQRSCGHRLEDALASHFGWPFVEAVMAPLIETRLGGEIAKERAEIAAREDRLARLYRAASPDHPAVRVVRSESRSFAPPPRVED